MGFKSLKIDNTNRDRMRTTPSSPTHTNTVENSDLQDLYQELRQISLQVARVEGRLTEVEQGHGPRRARTLQQSRRSRQSVQRRDRHGRPLTVGDRVSFRATQTTAAGVGVIVRFSRDSSRAIIRPDGPTRNQQEIHRAPYNTTLVITNID